MAKLKIKRQKKIFVLQRKKVGRIDSWTDSVYLGFIVTFKELRSRHGKKSSDAFRRKAKFNLKVEERRGSDVIKS